MKFGKQLAYNSVPEWRSKYLNYRKGKQLIKESVRKEEEQKRRRSSAGHLPLGEAYTPKSTGSKSNSIQLLDPEASEVDVYAIQEMTFFEFLDAETSKINNFYREQEMLTRYRFQELKELSVQLSDDNLQAFELKKEIVEYYRELDDLHSYCELNFTGFEKIMKKHDKRTGLKAKEQYMTRVKEEYFHTHNKYPREMMTEVEKLYAEAFEKGNLTAARNTLKEVLKEMIVWKRQTIWRDMLYKDRKKKGMSAVQGRVWKPIPIILACIVFLVVMFTPFMAAHVHARRCMAIFLVAIILWASEGLPLFVTAMLLPLLIVFSHCKLNQEGVESSGSMATKDVANGILKCFGDKTLFLILGGFTLAGALSKYSIDKRIASLVVKAAGVKPGNFMFAIMLLGLFASMWISNVASPVLCLSVIHPVISELPSESRYIRGLLLGIAFACNIGGMLTPIASPQNAYAISAMEDHRELGSVGFGMWMVIAIPVGAVLTVLTFFILYCCYKPNFSEVPLKAKERQGPIDRFQVVVLLVTFLTICLWIVQSSIEDYIGNAGVIGLIPMVLFFGFGLLDKEDFNNLPWHLVFLVGGGIALGDAVKSSGLLKLVAGVIAPAIKGYGPWVAAFSFSVFMSVAATFISHTVSAIIILPIVAEVGAGIGGGDHMRLMVVCAALLCSGAMGLPISSFPNVSCFSTEDAAGKTYLKMKDMAPFGMLITFLSLIMTMSAGFGMLMLLGY